MKRLISVGKGCYDEVCDHDPQTANIFEVILPAKGFPLREQQRACAASIAYSFDKRRRLLVEAPCGVGKTYSYAYPAAFAVARPVGEPAPELKRDPDTREMYWQYANGARVALEERPQVVVSTAGLTLQAQLVRKDLPAVKALMEKEFGKTFDVALLKGWSNYYCPAQALLEGQEQRGDTPEQAAEVARVQAWAKTTTTGDRLDLGFEPDPKVWRRFAISSDDCVKGQCRFYAECPAQLARRAALRADLVVTNHHLLISSRGYLVPRHHLVMDEVHEVPDIARDLLGFKLFGNSLTFLWKTLMNFASTEDTQAWIREMMREIEAQWGEFAALRSRFSEQDRDRLLHLEEIATALHRFDGWAEEWGEVVPTLRSESAMAMKLRRLSPDETAAAEARRDLLLARVEKLTTTFRALCDSPEAFALNFTGAPEKPPGLEGKYIDIGPHVDAILSNFRGGIVGTSATVTAQTHSFEFLMGELGASRETTDLLEVGSPFDFASNGLLVLPRFRNTDPNTDAWRNEMFATMVQCVRQSEGRALLLFTSRRNMNAAYTALADAQEKKILPRYTVRMQGDASNIDLIRQFREEESSVLIGTLSFWTGVDVPGASLSLVFIDKLPFPMMNDPIIQAVRRRDERGWFQNHSLPRAALTLKQGVGRLIRSTDDRGVVVICDPRMHTHQYGKVLVSSLPPFQVTTDVKEIGPFLTPF